MKFALISDIHANAAALQKVLELIKAQNGIEKIYCLGDVVGFHTSPGKCIDLLEEHRVACIAGNHDRGVTGQLGEEKFPWECWEGIQWTRKNINSRQLKFLESLPSQTVLERQLWMMHGIFGDPHHYMVGNGKQRYAFLRLRLSGIRFGFYGHIHKQTCFKTRSPFFASAIDSVEPSGMISLDNESSYLINPGTVGHPRTNDHQASFAIVDLDQHVVQFERITYDYAQVLEQTLDVFPGHVPMYKRLGSL